MPNWLNELIEGIKDRIKDRFSDQFLSMLTFSYVAVNWKFFYVFIKSGESDIGKSIELAEKQISYPYSIVAPLTITIIYICVYPLLRLGVTFIQALYKNLELMARKMEYVKPEVLNELRSTYYTKENNLRTSVLETYKFFILDETNQNFSYNYQADDQSIEVNKLYSRNNGVFSTPKSYSQQALCYIVGRIEGYLIYTHIPSIIPLPLKLADSAESKFFIDINGKITFYPESIPCAIVVTKLDHKRASIEYVNMK